MKYKDKLKKLPKEAIWKEYCGFLDLSMQEYMYIQDRLMTEQLRMWSASPLGKHLLGSARPETPEALRQQLPLTSYEDYANALLPQREESLPEKPVVWIQTTWEGGLRPIKLAPYTRAMLDCYRHNVIAIAMLASSHGHGDFDVKNRDRVLYGGAPLPYATGLFPSLVDEELDFEWLPDSNQHSDLGFSQRIKKGFKMALSGGADYFFAIGSVANYITENFGASTGGSGLKSKPSLGIALRYLAAKYRCKRDARPLRPGDVFRLKGFVSSGTDAACYRERLAEAWGVTPIEIAAGTESTCIATETWEHCGMVFFPDACYYEFIPEAEMLRSLREPDYTPRTLLMNEVREGENYELVISVFHGGAFMRYRIGDVYRCVRRTSSEALPYFAYVDRVPNVIDIAGFTRITEASIERTLRLSGLGVGNWLARKEFDAHKNPFLHMYIEIKPDAQIRDVTAKQLITEHLAAYFKYFDSDYSDLKKLLNMEPLHITIVKYGTIARIEERLGRPLPRINADALDLNDLLRCQRDGEPPSSGKGAGE